MARKKELGVLIRTIFEKGDCTEDLRTAIDDLAKHGDAAVDAMVEAMKTPAASTVHPRDTMDAVGWALSALARKSSDRLIDRMEDGSLGASLVYGALANARGERSLDVLIKGLRDESEWARWAAASSLIRRESRRAVLPIIDLLKDRSSIVKSEVVFSMKDRKWLRRPEALPLLRRLRANKSVQKHSVGTWRAAQEVIDLIEAENGDRTETEV